MSKRICERCKSENVIEDIYYGGTQYYECQSCLCRGDKDNFPEMALFHQITASEEVLAEKFVYQFYDCDGHYWWTSTLCNYTQWELKSEAIAATVAKLKEVCDE